MPSLSRFVKTLQIDRKKEADALDGAIREFDIRTGRKDILAGQLSGGNQQKLLLAKMMMLDPEIVIIDEPTRGIDIGNKEQIYKFIAKLAEEGRSIIVVSSEMPELIGISDRILVMRAGHIVGEVTGDEDERKRDRRSCDRRQYRGGRVSAGDDDDECCNRNAEALRERRETGTWRPSRPLSRWHCCSSLAISPIRTSSPSPIC